MFPRLLCKKTSFESCVVPEQHTSVFILPVCCLSLQQVLLITVKQIG